MSHDRHAETPQLSLARTTRYPSLKAPRRNCQFSHVALSLFDRCTVPRWVAARLSPEAKAHRTAPNNWRDGVIHIAESQIMRYRKLIEDVRREAADSQ